MAILVSMTSGRPISLTACLIVKDEEKHLPSCLSSVQFCDEVIVVDSGSTDRTVEIARAAGATVLERPWMGFAAQRNIALDAAHGEWVLEVDADEVVTPELRDEIIALIADPPPEVDNASVPRREVFLGVALGPAARYPACITRLFRRDRYRHDDSRTVHEGIWPAGRSAYPNGHLRHIAAESLLDGVRDVRSYARLESKHMQEGSRRRAVIAGIAVRPVVKFGYRLWLLGGWRDGFAGLTKIALDCLYDSLTWIYYVRAGRLARHQKRPTDGVQQSYDAHAGNGAHFGRTLQYGGPPRIAAVACGVTRAAAAHDWLERAAHEGCDVVLITDAPPAVARVRMIEITRVSPLAVLRALAGEDGRNPIEVLMLPGRCERVASQLLPRHLRGVTPAASLRTNPRELSDTVLGMRRNGRRDDCKARSSPN